MKKTIIFLFFIIFLFSFNFAYAQIVPCGPGTGVYCTLCHFFQMLGNIINFLYTIAFSLAIIMIVTGGILMVMSQINPNSGELQRAKDTFKSVFIGLFIIYGGWLILNLFFWYLTGRSDWYIITC